MKLTAFDKDEKGLLKEADTTVWEKKSSTDEYDHYSVWVDADRKMAGFTVYEGTKNYYGVYRLENGRWREKKRYIWERTNGITEMSVASGSVYGCILSRRKPAKSPLAISEYSC